MKIGEKVFLDHLGYLFASPNPIGKIDLSTMTMHLPPQWREDPIGVLVRAHELIHLRLTYSTEFGIFLDMISGLSCVKLFDLLKNTTRGEVLLPLSRNLEDSSKISMQVRGNVAFSSVCDIGIDAGISVWRHLQEGIATYAMLELAPNRMSEETVFPKSEIEKARSQIYRNLHGIYLEGYLECLHASKVVGTNQVYAAAFLASEAPLYMIDLFTSSDGEPLKITGLAFYEEIQRFCQAISSQSMNPIERFRKLIQLINNDRANFSSDVDLKSFGAFLIPELFPSEDWRDRLSKWISTVTRTFGDPESNQALDLYSNVVDRGWGLTLFYPDEKEPRIGFLKGYEETGILRYALGSLKIACLRNELLTIRLPSNWHDMRIKSWIQDLTEIVEKHRLPIQIEEFNTE